ncbi:MAG: uroporphyrinogen-III synthase, partial [Legionellales bacterium]
LMVQGCRAITWKIRTMNQSLHGLRILNTRPKDQAYRLSKEILEKGGVAIECPALEIKATPPDWVDSLPDLWSVDYAIFISANAVHCCFKQLHQKNIPWPSSIKVITIGQGSARALKDYEITPFDLPDQPDSEQVLALASLQTLKDKTVLLFKGEGGRRLIEEGLQARKAKLYCISVYRREMPGISHQFLKSIWQEDLVDIILVTSEQSLYNLFTLFGTDAKTWLQNKTCLVLSDRLAKVGLSLGMTHITICHPERIISALLDYTKG